MLFQAFAASIYDELRGAVSNVERGFGKLISDVVTDVKETLHCTLSAVEQVLVLKGVLDKTSAYDYRCREIVKQQNAHVHKSPFDRLRNFTIPSHEFSTRHMSAELESSIENTNKSINDILRRPLRIDKTYPAKILHEETHRLVEISELLKNELEKLSSNVRREVRNSYYDNRSNSVDSIWNEIKTLHDIQRKSNNEVEIKEIRHILDKVVNKLDMIVDHNNSTGGYNIDDIKKKLQGLSNKNIDNPSHGDQVAQKVILHDSQSKSETTKDVPKPFKKAAQKSMQHNKEKGKISDKKQSHAKKSVFDLDSGDLAGLSPLKNANSNQKDTIKKIIQDSKQTDKVLNQFFKNRKAGVDVFSNSDTFTFS